MLSECHAVIIEQLEQDVVEKAPEKAEGKEFYLPHQAVVKEEAETTKLRIVYDASPVHIAAPFRLTSVYMPDPHYRISCEVYLSEIVFMR